MSEQKKKSIVLVLVKDIIFFIITFVIIISFIFASSQVNQSSMDKTLHEGERLIEYKLSYFFSGPERGDIVIFAKKPYSKNFFNIIYQSVKYLYESRTGNFENRRLIKRVIGLPGEEIDIKNGSVFIDGEKLDENYVSSKTFPQSLKLPQIIPEDKYFVMGDNRKSSFDSRSSEIGFVDMKTQIEGKIVFRIWPFEKFGKVD